MRCTYCDSQITNVPENRICPFCGGQLPYAAPAPQPAAPVQPPVQPQIIYQVQPPVYQVPLTPGINCCGRCMSQNITVKKRGFSWGWGIFWFFMIPVFGIFLGFVGSNKRIYRCQACGHKWRR